MPLKQEQEKLIERIFEHSDKNKNKKEEKAK